MGVLKQGSLLKENYKNKSDGLILLSDLLDESISCAFFDPQYRGVLDKLRYGNEGQGRGKARSDLVQMSEDVIMKFIKELDRVIKPSGHLFIWIDKFHLCTGVNQWFNDTNFCIVDLLTWDKGKIGMGYRTRRKAEYLLVLQKKPVRAKGVWTLHNIPDVWIEKVIKTHPHSKPINLQEQLILATTNKNDYVCDPASGGYSVFGACKSTGRNFVGCDIEFGD